MNNVNLIGRLGRDPETRYTSSGKAVTNFSLAVDDGFGDRKKTNWFKVTVFDKQAEAVQQYTSKGSQVAVSGRLTVNQWEDKQGQRRETTEIIASFVDFLTPKSDRQAGQQSDAAEPAESEGTTDFDGGDESFD